jgi:hypothetical protein
MFAMLLAAVGIFALVGCGASSSSSDSSMAATPKDYAQIIHDARTEEFNTYMMIVSPGEEEGTYAAIDGTADAYEPEYLADEVNNMTLPMLGLQPGDYTDFAASVSLMMTRSYGVAIVMPAEGKTDDVKAALENYVQGQQLSMENYLVDQYEIAQAATVTVVPTGEVVLVCSENGAEVLASIEAALAA